MIRWSLPGPEGSFPDDRRFHSTNAFEFASSARTEWKVRSGSQGTSKRFPIPLSPFQPGRDYEIQVGDLEREGENESIQFDAPVRLEKWLSEGLDPYPFIWFRWDAFHFLFDAYSLRHRSQKKKK